MEIERLDGSIVRVDVADDRLGSHHLLLIDNFSETLVETDRVHRGKVKAVHRVPKFDSFTINAVSGDSTENKARLRWSHETVRRKESVASAVHQIVSKQTSKRWTAARTPRRSQA